MTTVWKWRRIDPEQGDTGENIVLHASMCWCYRGNQCRQVNSASGFELAVWKPKGFACSLNKVLNIYLHVKTGFEFFFTALNKLNVCRVATSQTTTEPVASPSTETNSRTRTSLWSTQGPGACPWPTPDPTPTARSSSSAQQTPAGQCVVVWLVLERLKCCI